jgi:hypothetical protein
MTFNVQQLIGSSLDVKHNAITMQRTDSATFAMTKVREEGNLAELRVVPCHFLQLPIKPHCISIMSDGSQLHNDPIQFHPDASHDRKQIVSRGLAIYGTATQEGTWIKPIVCILALFC